MRRLILFRHAKAEPGSSTGEDFDRPLAPRGRSDAALMGRVLAEAGYAPDLALVSSARRTQQTWEGAAPAFPSARTQVVDRLYHAEPDALLEEAELVEADTVMVVAHNPGLHQLAVELAQRGVREFPTASVAVFERLEGGEYRLEALFYPHEHGGGR